MAVVCACFALLMLCLFNLSFMTYIRAVQILQTPLYFKHLCIIRTSLHSIDTSPYCGHLSIMNAICILWTPLHTVDTSPCILWTTFHYECNMHTMDTSSYCGHLSIMNTICILQTPLHSSFHILWTPLHTSHYYTHLCINYEHPYTPRKPMHNMDPSAYYRHLCILQSTPMHTVHVPWTPTVYA